MFTFSFSNKISNDGCTSPFYCLTVSILLKLIKHCTILYIYYSQILKHCYVSTDGVSNVMSIIWSLIRKTEKHSNNYNRTTLYTNLILMLFLNFDAIKRLEERVLKAMFQVHDKDLILSDYTFCNIIKKIIAMWVE